MSVNVPPTSTSIVLRSFVADICSALLHGQPLVADFELAVGEALAEPVKIELDDADPVGVGRERVLALDDRLVDLARIAMVDLAGVLVVPVRGAEVVPAHVAVPAL